MLPNFFNNQGLPPPPQGGSNNNVPSGEQAAAQSLNGQNQRGAFSTPMGNTSINGFYPSHSSMMLSNLNYHSSLLFGRPVFSPHQTPPSAFWSPSQPQWVHHQQQWGNQPPMLPPILISSAESTPGNSVPSSPRFRPASLNLNPASPDLNRSSISPLQLKRKSPTQNSPATLMQGMQLTKKGSLDDLRLASTSRRRLFHQQNDDNVVDEEAYVTNSQVDDDGSSDEDYEEATTPRSNVRRHVLERAREQMQRRRSSSTLTMRPRRPSVLRSRRASSLVTAQEFGIAQQTGVGHGLQQIPESNPGRILSRRRTSSFAPATHDFDPADDQNFRGLARHCRRFSTGTDSSPITVQSEMARRRRSSTATSTEDPAQLTSENGLGGEKRLRITFANLGEPFPGSNAQILESILRGEVQGFGKNGWTVPHGLEGTHSMYGQNWRFLVEHKTCMGGVVVAWSITNLASNTLVQVVETPSQALHRQTKGDTICNSVLKKALDTRADELEDQIRRGGLTPLKAANLQSLVTVLRPSQCTEGLLFFGLRHKCVQMPSPDLAGPVGSSAATSLQSDD